jgi:hypothetical protein
MASTKPATLREKHFNMMVSSDEAPKHGHWMEYFQEVSAIACNIMFVFGSYDMMSSNDTVYATGDWLFILACVVNTLWSTVEVAEKLHHANLLQPKERDEVLEAAWFFVANLLFTVGCVFFLPSMEARFTFSAGAGAWLCIVGSFGLTFGVFYSALGFESHPGQTELEQIIERRCRKMVKVSILLLLVGTAFFTVGSFMYRPIFGGKCEQGSTDDVCEAVSAYGTKCYLYGSYAFLVSSCLNLAVCVMKANGERTKGPTENSKLMYTGA